MVRFGLIAGVALLALAGSTSGGPDDAAALRDTTAHVHDGRENIGFFVVPVERVDPYVPDHYQLLDDAAGTTTVIVRTAEYRSTTLGGEPGGRLRSAVAAVEIEPPDDNSGTVNWYILYWANDNPEFSRFLRGNTPSYPAVDVPGITCTFTGAAGTHAEDCVGETPGGIWQSQAPPPTPSPFDMTAVVTDSLVDLGDAVGHYWRDVPEGTVRISSAVAEGDSFVPGPAAITVTTPANTPLAGILGGPARVAELGISELTSGSYTRTLIDTNTLLNSGAGTDNVCSSEERRGFLAREQMRILALVRSYGPEASDLTTLRDESDLARLAQPDPEAATVYNFYPHQFVSFAGMGFAVLNTGALGPGKPDLLLYAPNPQANNVADPNRADFPYTLAGWGYLSPYDHEEQPRFLGECIRRGDWFVHERGIHPADDWGMHAVPPLEHEHGQDPGQEPVLPTECQQLTACPTGIQHGRMWDIHLWLGDRGRATVSMLSQRVSIAGIDPEVGVDFFYPQGGRAIESDCDVVDAIVRVPVDNIRPLVPAEFHHVIAENVPTMADLAIGGAHCRGVSVNGGPTRETTWAYFRVALSDPDPKEDIVAEPTTGETTHLYTFWIATDNPEFASFFRSQGGMTANGPGSNAVYVEEIEWYFDTVSGEFTLQVPPPAPSPFRIEATITERLTPPADLVLHQWAGVPSGVMEMPDDNIDGLTAGLALGRVFPAAGSAMDVVFCDDTDGSFGVDSGSLDLHFTNSSYTLVVRDPFELFGVNELSDTGPATCSS